MRAVILLLLVNALVADDISNLYKNHDKYARAVNNIDFDTEIGLHERSRRQASSSNVEEYYVTQCGYDNPQQPDGASIQVQGKSLQLQDAALATAKLIHLLVRFMPRKLFLTITEKNTVGVFPVSSLPALLFPEIEENMPPSCSGRCGTQFRNGEPLDCSPWCTTTDYPFQNQPYPINYLWAYGNFSRLFVVENNVVCKGGFNPLGSVNLLVREFGFMMMSRILDDQAVADIIDAYNIAEANNTWAGIQNEYEYFIFGTLAWYNAVSFNNQLKGMACTKIVGNNGLYLCSDDFEQRQFIKRMDNKLYKILNYVYNNNREYVNGEITLCGSL